MFFSDTINNIPTGIRFIAFGGNLFETAEAQVQTFIDKNITLLRNNVNLNFNTSVDIIEITFRDDGVDVPNSKITIPAATTGKFSSGDISENIANGSFICEEIEKFGAGDARETNILAELEK